MVLACLRKSAYNKALAPNEPRPSRPPQPRRAAPRCGVRAMNRPEESFGTFHVRLA